jgi:magnesium chelatase family protein
VDRIDLFTSVHEIDHDKLLVRSDNAQIDNAVRERIAKARELQTERFGGPGKLNTDMTNTDIRQLAHLEPAAANILNIAARKLNISARAYMRTIKIARSIADLEACATITEAHLTEALAYRFSSFKM